MLTRSACDCQVVCCSLSWCMWTVKTIYTYLWSCVAHLRKWTILETASVQFCAAKKNSSLLLQLLTPHQHCYIPVLRDTFPSLRHCILFRTLRHSIKNIYINCGTRDLMSLFYCESILFTVRSPEKIYTCIYCEVQNLFSNICLPALLCFSCWLHYQPQFVENCNSNFLLELYGTHNSYLLLIERTK
jgi:hypothetical protein